jgi:hypothetical protein
VLSGISFAQTGAVSPGDPSAKPTPFQLGSSASEEWSPGRCMPIGVTISGENVFPFQCKNFIELQSEANTKPASEEVKPAAEEKFSPAEDKSEAAAPLPLSRRPEVKPGCTHFRSYDPVSGTYMAYGGRRHQCTTAGPAQDTKAVVKEPRMARLGARVPTERYDTPGDWVDEMMAVELYQRLNHLETVARNNTDKTPSQPQDDADLLVAILVARPEITSISDLAGKSVAIDDKYSASNGNVRIAIVAAGAPDVQLRELQTAAIDRLVSGDVPAAVLALVSARAADGFPEISGYRIFHIPLSPRSLESRH